MQIMYKVHEWYIILINLHEISIKLRLNYKYYKDVSKLTYNLTLGLFSFV